MKFSRVTRSVYLSIILVASILAVNVHAQKKQKEPAKSIAKNADDKKTDNMANKRKSINLYRPKVYLGNSEFCGGPIKRATFDSLISHGLKCYDSMGRPFRIISYYINFYEHQFYEDASGNLTIMTDKSGELCHGDSLTQVKIESLRSRVKFGDTVIFESIRMLSPAITGKNDTFRAATLNCYIQK